MGDFELCRFRVGVNQYCADVVYVGEGGDEQVAHVASDGTWISSFSGDPGASREVVTAFVKQLVQDEYQNHPERFTAGC